MEILYEHWSISAQGIFKSCCGKHRVVAAKHNWSFILRSNMRKECFRVCWALGKTCLIQVYVYVYAGSVEFRVNFEEVPCGLMCETKARNFAACTFNDLNGF